MNLNYQEIMELAEPENGADVGTMESICSVYAHLVAKFTRLLAEARQIKVCWMQEERMALYAKRLAANQREYRCIERQRRAGEITNFCLRVREWVLRCPKRRLQLRALIGESRIAKWQGRRLAYQNRVNIPSAPTKQSKASGTKTVRRYEVRNWYRLPFVSQDINARDPKPLRKKTPIMPAAHGMCRAIPAVVFWPDELAADYVHGPETQISQDTSALECKIGMEHQKKVDPSPLPPSHMGARTAREWPD